MLKYLVIVVILCTAATVKGQLIEADTTAVLDETVLEENIHSPKKATIYSAILPGLGQAYNKKYWKIPLVYIGFGTIGYFIDWNNGNYKFYKQAYSDLTDGNDDTKSYLLIPASKYYDLENPADRREFGNGLNRQQDYFRRNRDLLVISIVGFYGLNIIDASVDAHLFEFDMSEDLTFNWQPSMRYFDDQLVYGINCTFNF